MLTWPTHLVAPVAEVLAQLVAEGSPAAVLLASSAEGKEIAARLALKTGSGVLTDATDLSSDAGKVLAEQQVFGGSTDRAVGGDAGAPRSSPCGRTRSRPSRTRPPPSGST